MEYVTCQTQKCDKTRVKCTHSYHSYLELSIQSGENNYEKAPIQVSMSRSTLPTEDFTFNVVVIFLCS